MALTLVKVGICKVVPIYVNVSVKHYRLGLHRLLLQPRECLQVRAGLHQ